MPARTRMSYVVTNSVSSLPSARRMSAEGMVGLDGWRECGGDQLVVVGWSIELKRSKCLEEWERTYCCCFVVEGKL